MVWASRGLAAGSVLAIIELRLLLLEAGDRMVACSLYCRLTLYVDNAAIETSHIAKKKTEYAKVVDGFVQDLA